MTNGILTPVQQVTMFTNIDFGDVRAFIDDRNTPWFVAADVCYALGINYGTSNIYKVLEKWEKGTYTINTPGGPQKMVVVNEGGLYHLIFVSRKPQAKRFQHWVSHEVLPKLKEVSIYHLDTLNNPNYKQIIELIPPWIRDQYVSREDYNKILHKVNKLQDIVRNLILELDDRDAKIARFIEQRKQYDMLSPEEKKALDRNALFEQVERYKYKSDLNEHSLSCIGEDYGVSEYKMDNIINGIQDTLDYDDTIYVKTGKKHYDI